MTHKTTDAICYILAGISGLLLVTGLAFKLGQIAGLLK